jgi:hypothetical protein
MKTRWLDRRLSLPGPYLALCLSQAEFDAALKHLKTVERSEWLATKISNATTHFIDDENGRLCALVCIDQKDRTSIEVAGLLVHEAVHVWRRHARSIGENAPADEQEAYAIQSISQELMAEFARRVCGATNQGRS